MILDDGLCMLNDTWEWLMRIEDGEGRLILVDDSRENWPTDWSSFRDVQRCGRVRWEIASFSARDSSRTTPLWSIQTTHQHQPAKPLEPTSQPQGLSHGAASIQRQFRQLQRCFVAAAAVTVIEATLTLARRRGEAALLLEAEDQLSSSSL